VGAPDEGRGVAQLGAGKAAEVDGFLRLHGRLPIEVLLTLARGMLIRSPLSATVDAGIASATARDSIPNQ
jgi:hypothetical protein